MQNKNKNKHYELLLMSGGKQTHFGFIINIVMQYDLLDTHKLDMYCS